ncbi:MAG: hypothetical protein WDM77_10695 [Steroidobacteraceae bacterium]
MEVTWSPLTRWIKNSMLGYDATAIAMSHSGSGRDIQKCPDDQQDTLGNEGPTASNFHPPDRLFLNANLKWGVLDRSLADALIYTGTYGAADAAWYGCCVMQDRHWSEYK